MSHKCFGLQTSKSLMILKYHQIWAVQSVYKLCSIPHIPKHCAGGFLRGRIINRNMSEIASLTPPAPDSAEKVEKEKVEIVNTQQVITWEQKMEVRSCTGRQSLPRQISPSALSWSSSSLSPSLWPSPSPSSSLSPSPSHT